MTFKPWSIEQKQNYAKRFSKKERSAYRRGLRNGWLRRHHDKSGKYEVKKSTFMTHKFTDDELNNMYDNLDNFRLY